MRKILARTLMVVAVLSAAPVWAQSNKVVVELYTSQGCSSCPPADVLLGKLANRDGVIALSMHVDYWDYIGWKDIFASPQFTKRQHSYAHAAQRRSVYTPQMVIGGTEHVVGTKAMEVLDMIADKQALDTGVALQIKRQGQRVVIAATMSRQARRDLLIQVVRYAPTETVQITRGENSGRTLEYHNVVTEWRQVGKWNGDEPLNVSVPAKGNQPIVVILQMVGPGQILAAAELR